ncbi:iron-containing alcohol dehydrogenase [Pontibacter sp. G13]|uniref:iron-containing alcohol dehydrogenase n=1 Tax=Pontibacter sp. G13 TaxID=3074898 RepID=UPI00288BAEA3|nr:iron-containing alcohol dehydrogenase [Pontibacter sp. G13]WNJ17312.1 iron-containing alcohol dehydrogenase [Pontibacter sp. G13]
MNTSLSFPTQVRFGAGVISELPAYLQSESLTRPLVVTDPMVRQLPFFEAIVDQLTQAGLDVSIFSEMHKNPVKSDVLAGGDAYEAGACDCIVGIGGGVAMDVARAIALRIHHRRDLFDYDDLIGGDVYVTEEVPPLITVPTTSGTGSEVGRSAIISEDDSKRKRILFSPKLMAQQVFADPALTMELPPSITATTGMDALTHNLEAYLAKNWNPLCDGIALQGIRLIMDSIETAVKHPTMESRANMMIASLMGATAFQKGLGVVHSLAHPLSTLLDMHHGLANAITLPYGMRFNLPHCQDKFKDLAWAMKLHGGPDAVIDELFKLNDRLGIEPRLRDHGVEESHLPTLSELAEADFAHPNNPVPVTREDFMELYLAAY